MSIRPVDMNGVIQRTQDVGTLKQQQDMKPMVDQQNIQMEVQREEYRQWLSKVQLAALMLKYKKECI